MRSLLGSIVDHTQHAITKLRYDTQSMRQLRVIGIDLYLNWLGQCFLKPIQLNSTFPDRC